MSSELIIALAGNPNAGKTTLFNALTGSHQHVGNYPGVTVDTKEGRYNKNGLNCRLVDLPGIYSLSPYSEEEVVSHDANAIHSTPVDSANNILLLASEVEVVGIDEAQFFDDSLVDVCNQLANGGVRVIIAGLDMDYRGIPFGPMPKLLSIAEYVTKVHAICVRCGTLANYTHRLSEDDKLIVLGETDIYEPLCRGCYSKANMRR